MLPTGAHSVGQAAAHEGPVLLDTHVWLWYVRGLGDRLPDRARTLLEHTREKHGLLISDASPWEVAIKMSARRLRMTVSAEELTSRVERMPGFSFVPLERALLLHAGALHDAPSDPFDRALIASSRRLGVPLMTADTEIVAYARSTKSVSVIALP